MISRLCCCPSQIPFFGVSHIPGVCGVAFSKECGKRFLLFRFKPYCCCNQNQLFGQILSKPECESNILVILFNFCPSLTTSINLHATSTFFMLDNVFQRTIYTLASITINIVQYLRNRHTFPKLTVTQIESNVRNFLRNKLLEISSFKLKIDRSLMNRRIDKSRKNRDEETK